MCLNLNLYWSTT
uniref:Uncharacterized protein n=1 Tax=Arundo donax TaxID=35708 RepID=A0A0A8YPQ0_ARUDO